MANEFLLVAGMSPIGLDRVPRWVPSKVPTLSIGALLRLLRTAIGCAVLDFRGQSRQGSVCAEVLAQATDVLNGDENSVSLRVIQLQVFGSGAIVGLKHPGTHVPADAVGGVNNQLARLKWRGEPS